MKRSLFALLTVCLVSPLALTAQLRLDLGRAEETVGTTALDLKPREFRTYIYDDIPAEYRSAINARKSYQFADESAFLAHSLLTRGAIYYNWRAAEVYINEILKRVVPEELQGHPYLRAYLVKEGSQNAFMTPSGMLFIHIGLLDDLPTEGSLAAVLAHELAHYTLRHSIEGFIKAERGEFNPGFLFKNKGAASSFSVGNELSADSLAVIYLQQAGYRPDGLKAAFELFQRIDEKRIIAQPYGWEVDESTHPSSDKRIAAIEQMITLEGGSDHLVSERAFLQLREKAKVEILKHLLANFNYKTCLERAFKYHLYDPNNPTYVWYVMEAIRRRCYLNSSLWQEKFIVDSYYEAVDGEGEGNKQAISGHFFDQFRAEILGLPHEAFDDIEAKFYWEGPPRFITNEQAFQFFFQIGELIQEPECLLSNALSLYFSQEKRDRYLKQYLASEDIYHREFAEALLNDKVHSSLPDRKLTVFDRFFTLVRQGPEQILLWDGLTAEDQSILDIAKEAVSQYSDREFICLQDWRSTNLGQYLTLLRLENFASSFLIIQGEAAELHVLDPMYWELMREFEVNEIEFINCLYRDVVKSNNSVEGLQAISGSYHNDYLTADKKTGRHLNIFLTSLRIKEDPRMKLRYYTGEDRLKTKNTGYQELAELLREKLAEFDEVSSLD
ncbi:MAG: M48 family metallopeptidase [Bacteroidota bacterium]